MDKIFGGIKAAYLRDYEREGLGNSVKVGAWLSTYVTESAWRHKKELDMVIRAICRVTDNHTEDTLYKYMSALVNDMYLQRVFEYDSREVGGRINAASMLIPSEMNSIMEHQIGGFPTLIKAIIGEILREEPTKKKNKVRR